MEVITKGQELLDIWYDVEQRHKKNETIERHFIHFEIETGVLIEYKRMNAHIFFELLSHVCEPHNQTLRERVHDKFLQTFINEQEDVCLLMKTHYYQLQDLLTTILQPENIHAWN